MHKRHLRELEKMPETAPRRPKLYETAGGDRFKHPSGVPSSSPSSLGPCRSRYHHPSVAPML